MRPLKGPWNYERPENTHRIVNTSVMKVDREIFGSPLLHQVSYWYLELPGCQTILSGHEVHERQLGIPSCGLLR